MSEIDPEKLEEALKTVSLAEGYMSQYQSIIVAAARAHLATLPKWKEVEVVQFAVIRPDGTVDTVWKQRDLAQDRAEAFGVSHSVVRLTGTAKIKVQP